MAKPYFDQLNYTMANEDTGLELEILPDGCAHVVAVCGSGSRVLPLLSKKPKKLSVVDVSPFQLALCELRLESIRLFSHSEFLAFWGYDDGVWGMARQARKAQFEKIPLRSSSKQLLIQAFESVDWDSILLAGRWERTFVMFSKIAKWILGEERIRGLFECKNIEEQKKYVSEKIVGWRWRLLIAIVGNARTFNTFLYRGDFPVNNTGIGYIDYYDRAYRRLFECGLARRNFFLQLTLTGGLPFSEGAPIEANASVFEKVKQALDTAAIEYVQEDLVTWLSRQKDVGFVSFSNVASYFNGQRESGFLNEIRGALSAGCLVVLRHYLHRPEGLDRSGFMDQTARFTKALASEKTQMYDVEVLERVQL